MGRVMADKRELYGGFVAVAVGGAISGVSEEGNAVG